MLINGKGKWKRKMEKIVQPSIRDLAVIGDKRTCALIDKRGSVVWYCPWRFDQAILIFCADR
jgi:hypothetical protein